MAAALPVAPLTDTEIFFKYKMLLKEEEYTSKKPLTVFVGTWNVNDKSPTTSLSAWLSEEAESPDIYAIGFQELDLSLLFDSTEREKEWCDAIVAGVDPRAKYVLVEKVGLVGMMLFVLVKKTHFSSVKNVACDTVGTGIMGMLGNKGGVSIRFELHNTSMCFVNSHLAAHTEELEQRNQDYKDICDRTAFRISSYPPISIKDHDQIYWLGDLNYRVSGIDTETMKTLLDKGNFGEILVCDQLIRQHQENNVFEGYQEGHITFRPTYKYDPGTDNWDSSKKSRAPAWCDRILWRGKDVEQLSYRSHPVLDLSDHKPVSATFRSHVKVIIEDKYRKVSEDVIKKMNEPENELVPQVTVDCTELEFELVKYLEPQIRKITITNTGQVPVHFEFIGITDETNFFKEWLFVEPYTGYIQPGEKWDIQLKIFVNKNSACKLNAGTDQLFDVLVLHLEGVEDYFVTLMEIYQRSCFGCSIKSLVHIKQPIREVSEETMVELESTLDQMVVRQSTDFIPVKIWSLVNHIYVHGTKEPKVFVQPGKHSEILKIRDWLDEGCVGTLPGSVHSAAEALLLLLESTAEPIIPYNLQEVCMSACDNYLQCKEIIKQLPVFRRNVFCYLCEFLQEMLTHSADNGLNAKNLASLFGTIFLRDTPHQSRMKYSKRYSKVNKKKASFIFQFLVNPQINSYFENMLFSYYQCIGTGV